MSKDPLKNWQLEEGGEPLEQWKLQDTEQELGHMRLQPTGGTTKDWQPVEYQRTPAKGGRNWILPSIVIVALLIALGYVGYVSLNRFDVGALTSGIGIGAATPTPEAVAPVAAAPTAAPTATSAPTLEPSPTPSPTPEPSPTPALISVRYGTVNDSAGVNARREPSTTAEIIRLLNNAERVTVVRQEGEWLQVILSDNQAAWVAAQFIDQSVGEQKTLEEWNATLVAAGLPPVTPAADAAAPASAPTQVTGAPVNVTVIADPGATVRLEPATEAQVVGEALLSTVLVATARTDAADWLLVTLPDGRRGWILSGLVQAAGDATTLPVQPANYLLTEGVLTAVMPTPAANAGFNLEVSGVVPAAPFTNTLPATGPAIAISDTVGVNARTAPTLTGNILSVLPNGAVLPALGRSPDNLWVQVELPDKQLAWVFRDAVNVSSNIDDAPVVGGEGDLAAPPTPAAPTDGAATATIASLLGSNVRATPDNNSEPIETAARGTTFPVTGRSADGAWLQVQLADGAIGWILATTAELNVDVATLPVVP